MATKTGRAGGVPDQTTEAVPVIRPQYKQKPVYSPTKARLFDRERAEQQQRRLEGKRGP